MAHLIEGNTPSLHYILFISLVSMFLRWARRWSVSLTLSPQACVRVWESCQQVTLLPLQALRTMAVSPPLTLPSRPLTLREVPWGFPTAQEEFLLLAIETLHNLIPRSLFPLSLQPCPSPAPNCLLPAAVGYVFFPLSCSWAVPPGETPALPAAACQKPPTPLHQGDSLLLLLGRISAFNEFPTLTNWLHTPLQFVSTQSELRQDLAHTKYSKQKVLEWMKAVLRSHFC